MVLVQDHLRRVGNRLVEWMEQRTNAEVLEQMLLVEGPAEHRFPRNVALMMYNEHPERFFPATLVDVVYFPEGGGHTEFTKFSRITGPVPALIRKALDLLQTNFIRVKGIKQQGKAVAVAYGTTLIRPWRRSWPMPCITATTWFGNRWRSG